MISSLECPMKLQKIIDQGYLIIRQADWHSVLDATTVEQFYQNIIEFRQGMRAFFERPKSERMLFQSDDNIDLRVSGYRCGYWPQGVYQDGYEGKKFPLEYYHSRNFYLSDRAHLFFPENNVAPALLTSVETLPHQQGYAIAELINVHLILPFLEKLAAYLPTPSPLSCILHIKPTYYREKVVLDLHRDKGFIQTIVGPASGMKIQPEASDQSQEFDLDIGEILIYTGFQFQDQFQNVEGLRQVKPLLHGVIANEEKRMSIVAGTFLKPVETDSSLSK